MRFDIARTETDWGVRAFGAALGAKSGWLIARYPDLLAAIEDTMRQARPLEAQGFEVHVNVVEEDEETGAEEPPAAPT